MAAGSGSLSSLRELNRLKVVDFLRITGTASRADIARRTGLSRSTVSTLVAELQRRGIVTDHDGEAPGNGRPGRPATLLALDPSAGAAVGVDFDHDRVGVAVSDLSRAVLAEAWAPFDVDHDAGGALDLAAEKIDGILDEADLERDRVLGAGMALAGPIDHERGALHRSAVFPGWAGVDAAKELEDRLGVPTYVDNDANCGALAEVTLGAGRNARFAAYVSISSGIGAGMIVDGRPYRGHAGTAGEIGHVVVDPQGPICRCGNRGCLETLASSQSLVALVQASREDELSVRDLLAARRRRRPRLPARDRRRRAGRGRRGGRAGEPVQPGDGRDRRRPWRGRRAAARTAERGRDAQCAPGRGGRVADRGRRAGRAGQPAWRARARAHAVRARSGRAGRGERGSVRRRDNTPEEEETTVSKRHTFWALAAAGVLAMSGLAACGDDDDDSETVAAATAAAAATSRRSAVLLPDSKSSVRWETVDRPFLQKAFEDAGVDADIQNAEGDKSTQQQQAEQAITNGAKVLLLVNLDSGSGAAIAANAASQGVKVIDYDRLTLDTDATDYYVSFDNEKVGELQGQGLVDCIGDKTRARTSPCSTARRPTTTPRCSRTATTRSSTRSSSRATGTRSTISPCPTGTTSRR